MSAHRFQTEIFMVVPDELRTNAYRTLGLSVNATSSEVHAAAGRAKRAISLGAPQKFPTGYSALVATPQTEEEIRSALGRIGNPSQRLHDRLFWFHKQWTPNAIDAATVSDPVLLPFIDQTELHDAALEGLLKAFEANIDDKGTDTWVRALSDWHSVVGDDRYWGLCWALEERGAFEPKALPSELQALRVGAVRQAAEGLIGVGRNSAVQGLSSTLTAILGILDRLGHTGSWAQTARVELSSLALEPVRELCRKVREECGSRVVRSNDSAEANKNACDAALRRYRNEVQPALQTATQFLPKGKEKENADGLREDAARCLLGIGIDYTWANDYIKSEELHKEALKLATGTLAAIKIEAELTNIRGSAQRQRVMGPLEPISAAPSLRTINGFGFHLYGNTDHDPETNSYATTYYFVGLFIPLIPLARYRVRDAGSSGYSFLGKLPLRKGDRWHQAIFVGAILWMFFSNSDGNSRSSSQAQYGTSSFGTPLPSLIPDSSTVSSPSSDSVSPAAATAQGSQALEETVTAQPVWRAPAPSVSIAGVNLASSEAELTRLKSEIENNRSQMAMLEIEIESASNELDRLESRMKSLKNEIDFLRIQLNGDRSMDVADFNFKVDEYNDLIRRQRSQLAPYRDNLSLYKQLQQRTNLLIDQYNALLR